MGRVSEPNVMKNIYKRQSSGQLFPSQERGFNTQD